MGRGGSPRCPPGSADNLPAPEEPNGEPPPSAEDLSPALLLVFFHKAVREELALLRRLAEGTHPGAASELRERFAFLKLAYKYHCAVEEEVIFIALDSRVDNIACTYSLEHRSIDELFESFFRLVEASLEKGGDKDPSSFSFQEIMFSLGTIQASMCQHMRKEEEQVFPLLKEKFTRDEQAALMWQFLCSVPIVLLEDIFPWMMSFLSPEEQAQVRSCLRDIVPREEPLQQLVTSWLSKKNRASLSSWSSDTEIARSSLSCFPIWHGAIRKDFEATLEELHQLRSSMSLSSLQSVVDHLKFLADVFIFYSNALDRVFYPVLAEISGGPQLPPVDQFTYKSQIESLQRFLLYNGKFDGLDSHVIDKLCNELELWVKGVDRFFVFHETEVFGRILDNCSHETQQQLLCSSIRTFPLGLLKCVITWFSSHLTAVESTSILQATRGEDYLVDKSFTLLLHEWFRVASMGKISVDKFRRDLEGICQRKFYFVSEQVKEATSRRLLTGREFLSCGYLGIEKRDMAYSSGSNSDVLFPVNVIVSREYKHSSLLVENGNALPDLDGEMPIDIVYYFHKALKKDLERLVLGSIQLTEDPEFLEDFRESFRLVQLLYQVHSNAEDEIAFPALEAKGKGANISLSYTIDHKLEVEHFNGISFILDKMSQTGVHSVRHELGITLQEMCRSMQKVLTDHIHHEEIEIWPLFRDCFSVEEQEKIAGSMLGRTRAEILKDMIPWLMGSLSRQDHRAMMRLWKRVTRNTMFSDWLGEWWDPEEYNPDRTEKPPEQNALPSTSFHATTDPLDIISTYLSKDILKEHEGSTETTLPQESLPGDNTEQSNADDEAKDSKKGEKASDQKSSPMSTSDGSLSETRQEELEAAIRRVSRDSSLDSKNKSYIIQNLLMSRWIISHRKSDSALGEVEEIPGSSPSYRDPDKQIYGCKHYKRSCKLLASCCNKLFTCRRCHDEVVDHTLDRKSITKMMCMKCLVIQPIGPKCSTPSCNNLSMGRYYCSICKIYDDEREIYHCPYCNLCRVGKGLGIDYFHCMNCNACMSRYLKTHICREKCFEDNCPICHEYIFTSNNPIKGLPCGHLMHSTCFQDYTCSHYTCPICSKSLGDMQVYFQMLDTLMAEEKMPDEYSGQTQVILCNDCEKRGSASFHWLYHKCPNCGSYNTRLL